MGLTFKIHCIHYLFRGSKYLSYCDLETSRQSAPETHQIVYKISLSLKQPLNPFEPLLPSFTKIKCIRDRERNKERITILQEVWDVVSSTT